MCPYLTLMMFKRLYFQGSSFRSPQVTLHWEGVLTLDFPRSLYWHLVPFFSFIITFHGSICNYEGKEYYFIRGKGIVGRHPTHCHQVLGLDIKGQSRLAGNLKLPQGHCHHPHHLHQQVFQQEISLFPLLVY